MIGPDVVNEEAENQSRIERENEERRAELKDLWEGGYIKIFMSDLMTIGIVLEEPLLGALGEIVIEREMNS